MKLSSVIATLLMSSVAFATPWDSNNNPNKVTRITGADLVLKFDSLPLSAKLTNTHFIWSDTYWPSQLGGVSYRWNAEPYPQPFRYKKLTREQVKNATLAQLEKLSPTEKYDIFMGNYDYPMTKRVMNLYSPSDLWWEGICHGWSAAAVSHPEPDRVNLVSADGVTVPFGSSDVKGLLSFYYAKGHKDYEYVQIGRRCDVKGKVPGESFPQDSHRNMPSDGKANKSICADTNAGAFHLVLANLIGVQNRGFVAEIDRFADVWNQPVGEYSSQIVSTRGPTRTEARNGVVRVVRVRTEMTYGEELNHLDPESRELEGGFMSMDPVTGTPNQTFNSRHYDYTLELNSQGEIIGGDWISITRPDFLWLKSTAEHFGSNNGFDFEGLNQIYKPVTR